MIKYTSDKLRTNDVIKNSKMRMFVKDIEKVSKALKRYQLFSGFFDVLCIHLIPNRVFE